MTGNVKVPASFTAESFQPEHPSHQRFLWPGPFQHKPPRSCDPSHAKLRWRHLGCGWLQLEGVHRWCVVDVVVVHIELRCCSSITVFEESKGLLLILKLSQVETHWIHFSFRCQPEVEIQSQDLEKSIGCSGSNRENGGTPPQTRAHSHLLVLKVHDDAQRFDNGSSAEKWCLSLVQEDLCLAVSAGDAHG